MLEGIVYIINLLWTLLYIIYDLIKFDSNLIIIYSTALAAGASALTAIATILLAYLNYRYLERIDSQIQDMHDQTSLLREQASIMQKDFKKRSFERKNKRLIDEMNLLVAKLYSSTENKVKWRPFTPVDPQYTMENRRKEHYLFWEDIRKNMHYTRDNILYNQIEKVLIIIDKFGDSKSMAEDQKRELESEFSNLSDRLRGIIVKRYTSLQEEIKGSEREIEAAEN
jgi:hypothetical protein